MFIIWIALEHMKKKIIFGSIFGHFSIVRAVISIEQCSIRTHTVFGDKFDSVRQFSEIVFFFKLVFRETAF